MGFTYLASPYTHEDPDVRQRRFEIVCRVAADMMLEGTTVFSVIAHGHSVETVGMEEPPGWEFWIEQCFDMLHEADELVVLMLEGWEESRGVQAEIAHAREWGIPCRYLAR